MKKKEEGNPTQPERTQNDVDVDVDDDSDR